MAGLRVSAFKKPESGQRGKSAESKIHDWLKEFDEAHIDFDFYRFPDARSAGGRAQTVPGDYEWFYAGGFGLLEVKELAHDCRLPAKNLKKHQVSRGRKRVAAGGEAHVIVSHTTNRTWRLVPMSFFFDKLDQTSWDLSEFKVYTNHRPLMQDLITLRVSDAALA